MPDPATEPPDAQPPDRPRPPGSIRIGTIAGSNVYVTTSWFLVAALIAVVVAPLVDSVQPGLGWWKYVAGLAFAVLLYLAVLLHEASHALMARRQGFVIEAITLHFLGGVTEIDGPARTPRQEFLIAVVGPLTSLAVGVGVGAVAVVVPDGLVDSALTGLAGANILIGTLNLVPGLPLDGGRVLKAGVWAVTGDQYRGTVAAGWGGRLAAIALLAWPFVQERWLDTPATIVDYVLVLFVAAFLWMGATAAMTHARLRSRLPHLAARPLARRTITVPDDLPLGEAVRRAQEAQAGSIVTVTSAGRPTGIVNEAAVQATPESRRPWVAVSTVSRTLEDGLSLPASLSGEELILAISRRPADEYLLLEDDGSVLGVLATADVDRAFRESQH